MGSSNDFLDKLIQQLSNGNCSGLGFTLGEPSKDKDEPDVCTDQEWEQFCNEMCLEDGAGGTDLGF